MKRPRSRARMSAAALLGALVALVTVADPAVAHTGLPAGGALDGVAHPVLGIDHLLAIVAVGVLAAMAADRRVAWLTPIGFVLGMAAGGLFGLAGIDVPGVELVIALSVVVLGALIAVVTRDGRLRSGLRAGLWLPMLAVAFGAVHGHAHGAELPAGALPVAYLAGFVLATAGLHVAGTGLGLGLRRLPSLRVATGAALATAGALMVVTG